MAKITQAVQQHKAANLPYLVYLRHPTMGGSPRGAPLGHVQLAEPRALIGFLGPRVYEALYGQQFPPGVQVSENLLECGIVDAVVPPEELAEVLGRILGVLMARRDRASPRRTIGPSLDAAPQPPSRTSPPDLHFSGITCRAGPSRRAGPARADGVRGHDAQRDGDGQLHPGSALALARFGGAPCVVLGQCRQGQTLDNPLDPAALREARRGMRLSRSSGCRW